MIDYDEEEFDRLAEETRSKRDERPRWLTREEREERAKQDRRPQKYDPFRRLR